MNSLFMAGAAVTLTDLTPRQNVNFDAWVSDKNVNVFNVSQFRNLHQSVVLFVFLLLLLSQWILRQTPHVYANSS